MASDTAEILPPPFSHTRASGGAEHAFFAAFALIVLATALLGFVPSSLDKVAAMRTGLRPPFPVVTHVHAALMGTWVMLFTVQSWLPAVGRQAWHRRLGVAAFVLVPAMLVAMILTTRAGWVSLSMLPPGAMPPEQVAGVRGFLSGILIEQIKTVLLLPLLIGWAMSIRRTDSAAHKRLMLVATLLMLPAAIDRLVQRWLPTSLPETYDSQYVYLLLWLAPALIFDLWRRGRIHRVYMAFIAMNVPFFLANHFLWSSPQWQTFAPRVLLLPPF